MGVWSTSLYGGDFARDLRSAIGAVMRLPFEPDRLVEALCETERGAAYNTGDPDHSTFWLVVADQFAKRGVPSDRARDTALSVIDNGTDLQMLEKLGMTAPDLAKRSKVLQEVRTRIEAAQPAAKPRPVLKKPQPYLMEVGDVFLYPTGKGNPINPYVPPNRKYETGPLAWTQDGWSAFVVIDRGRAFDFLTWYRPVTFAQPHSERPALEQVLVEPLWALRSGGTCSAVHYKRMQLEKIGTVPVDTAKLHALFPGLRPCDVQAISDISIGNRLSVSPTLMRFGLAPPGTPMAQGKGRHLSFSSIREILMDEVPMSSPQP